MERTALGKASPRKELGGTGLGEEGLCKGVSVQEGGAEQRGPLKNTKEARAASSSSLQHVASADPGAPAPCLLAVQPRKDRMVDTKITAQPDTGHYGAMSVIQSKPRVRQKCSQVVSELGFEG